MELDTKQKILLAIYTEYQNDLPNMKKITPESVGCERKAFNVAIEKLTNEELINGAAIVKSKASLTIWVDDIMMTNRGINYVETKLQIDGTLTGEEKVRKIMGKSAEWGFEQLKDFGAKVLAEMLK